MPVEKHDEDSLLIPVDVIAEWLESLDVASKVKGAPLSRDLEKDTLTREQAKRKVSLKVVRKAAKINPTCRRRVPARTFIARPPSRKPTVCLSSIRGNALWHNGLCSIG